MEGWGEGGWGGEGWENIPLYTKGVVGMGVVIMMGEAKMSGSILILVVLNTSTCVHYVTSRSLWCYLGVDSN